MNFKNLLKEFETKSIRVRSLLDKGDAIELNELEEARHINKELGVLKEKIQGLRDVEMEVKSYDHFLNEPERRIPIAGVNGVHLSGNTLLGSGGQIVKEEGEGIVETKTLNALRSTEYKSAFQTYLRKGEWGLNSMEVKTLKVGEDSEGGFLVPEDMLGKLIDKRTGDRRLLNHVTQLTTSRDSLLIPRVEYKDEDMYANGMRVNWVEETFDNENKHLVKDPVFGQISIPVYTAMMSLRVTHDMVEDSCFPIQNWIAEKFKETAELLQEEMILRGTGKGQPKGILNEAEISKLPCWNEDGSLNTSLIEQLAFSLPEQYLSKAKWIMNYNSMGLAIAQLKDGNKRPLWGVGLNDAGLENGYIDRRLVGSPVIFSGFMPKNEKDQMGLIFGDLSGYTMVKRIGFSVQVLREVEALRNRLVVVGRMRFGGAVTEPWKIKAGVCTS